MNAQPQTLSEYIALIREHLVCDNCGRYTGSLAESKYLPPPYAIAVDKVGPDDEVSALIAFEWHMLGLLRQGLFAIRHPQSKGRCVTVREWYDERADDEPD
jgi:hypothetical protein